MRPRGISSLGGLCFLNDTHAFEAHSFLIHLFDPVLLTQLGKCILPGKALCKLVNSFIKAVRKALCIKWLSCDLNLSSGSTEDVLLEVCGIWAQAVPVLRPLPSPTPPPQHQAAG